MFAPDAKPDDYRRFHDMLVDGYTEQLNGGEAQLVRHLQDIWQTFLPGTEHKLFKAIRKSRTLDQYQNAAAAALADVENALTPQEEEDQ
jgi:hypothetical protein